MAIDECSLSLGVTWRVQRNNYPREIGVYHFYSKMSFEGLRCFGLSRCGSYRSIYIPSHANIDHRPLIDARYGPFGPWKRKGFPNTVRLEKDATIPSRVSHSAYTAGGC